jgi:hypothetical protein
MAGGSFILHRFNGDETYRLQSGVMWASKEEGRITLWFEATADEDGAQRLPDTAEMGMVPYAEVAVALADLDPDALAGRRFSAPEPYVEELGGRIALLEYCDQNDLRDNEIEILRREGDRFHVRWTGITPDVNHYDGSKPDTRVEIEGEFLFQNLDEWGG